MTWSRSRINTWDSGPRMRLPEFPVGYPETRKDTEIRFASDLSYVDLKRSSAVLIGAFQNRWTLEKMKGRRFVFDIAAGSAMIRNQKTGQTWTLPGLKEDGTTSEDYMIITRTPRSDTGHFIVAAAGITQYGCQAAADVLTGSDLLPRTLKPD